MNYQYWTEEELKYIQENYGRVPLDEMSNQLNRSVSSIKHKAQRNDIKTPREWTEEEIQYLKDHYKTKTYKELSKYLDRTKSAVDLKINRLGLKKEKYTYNHSFFENVDTEEKAYWLGFIVADGGVSHNNEYGCELSIKLQIGDIEHLKKFNKSINGNNQITTFNRKCNLNDKFYQGCQLRLYSQKIVNDLSKYGIVPNKSLIIQLPQNIDEGLFRHFVRGVFDGDGCITKNRQKSGQKYNSYVKCDFTSGSKDFLEQLRIKLCNRGIKSYIVLNHDDIWKLVIGGMKNSDEFLHYIYDDATIYLDRKYKKKNDLYQELQIEQRLLRQSEKAGYFNLSEKENGNPEMGIRVEGYI